MEMVTQFIFVKFDMVFRKSIENCWVNFYFLKFNQNIVRIHFVLPLLLLLLIILPLHFQTQQYHHLILPNPNLENLNHLHDNHRECQHYCSLDNFTKILFNHFYFIIQLAMSIFFCLIILIEHLLIMDHQIYWLHAKNFDIDQLSVRNWFNNHISN